MKGSLKSLTRSNSFPPFLISPCTFNKETFQPPPPLTEHSVPTLRRQPRMLNLVPQSTLRIFPHPTRVVSSACLTLPCFLLLLLSLTTVSLGALPQLYFPLLVCFAFYYRWCLPSIMLLLPDHTSRGLNPSNSNSRSLALKFVARKMRMTTVYF